MSSRIFYAGLNQGIDFNKENGSILDASIEAKIPHLHECGGHGKCTTCRVRILDGVQNLSPMTANELAISQQRKWDPSIRLACQAKVYGDVKLQRLIWSIADVNRLQKEVVPEGRAEERAIAILFCDLRNFTTISSDNTAFDLAYMLNRFYTNLGEPILMNNGIIYQYVGDEIVGVFGTEGGDPQKICTDAIRAAKGMQYAMERLNKIELKDFDLKLEIGIGINYGKAFVGHLGHPTHRQFSVVGDPVNVASRIQGQTKQSETQILLSDNLYQHLVKEKLIFGKSFPASLEGKETGVQLHEFLDFQEMDIQLELQASLNMLLQDEDAFAQIFYDKVFEKAPFVRELFKNNMLDQGRILTHMLGGIVYSLARPKHLTLGLKTLGKNHERYGVKDEYYPLVKQVMLETIPEILGDYYTPRIGEAWDKALDFITKAMLEGKNG